jgi:hypothetical protein
MTASPTKRRRVDPTRDRVATDPDGLRPAYAPALVRDGERGRYAAAVARGVVYRTRAIPPDRS